MSAARFCPREIRGKRGKMEDANTYHVPQLARRTLFYARDFRRRKFEAGKFRNGLDGPGFRRRRV